MTKKIILTTLIATSALFSGTSTTSLASGSNTSTPTQNTNDKAPPIFKNDSYNDVAKDCKSCYKGDAHKTNMKTQKTL